MLIALVLLYITILVWCRRRRHEGRAAIVLGSGGHTAEMLRMLESSGRGHSEFTFWVSEGDNLSLQKLESKCSVILVPRPRKVGQSVVSSIARLPRCIFVVVLSLMRHWPCKIICNGPGLCFIVALFAKLIRLLVFGSLPKVGIVYIESVARVLTLSLTGKLMKHLADRFIVQWPELLLQVPPGSAECRLLV